MTRTMASFLHLDRAMPLRSFGEVVADLIETALTWRERMAQRRLLATADDRILGDIGIGRGEASAESEKPFWRA